MPYQSFFTWIVRFVLNNSFMPKLPSMLHSHYPHIITNQLTSFFIGGIKNTVVVFKWFIPTVPQLPSLRVEVWMVPIELWWNSTHICCTLSIVLFKCIYIGFSSWRTLLWVSLSSDSPIIIICGSWYACCLICISYLVNVADFHINFFLTCCMWTAIWTNGIYFIFHYL